MNEENETMKKARETLKKSENLEKASLEELPITTYVYTYQLYGEKCEPLGRGINKQIHAKTMAEARKKITQKLEEEKKKGKIICYKLLNIQTSEDHQEQLRK